MSLLHPTTPCTSSPSIKHLAKTYTQHIVTSCSLEHRISRRRRCSISLACQNTRPDVNVDLRDFENAVARGSLRFGFTDMYWFGLQELVVDITLRRVEWLTDTIRNPNANFTNENSPCDSYLQKYKQCMQAKVVNGDLCEPLKTNFRLCKQIRATMDNRTLETCINDSFMSMFRAEHPETSSWTLSQMVDHPDANRMANSGALFCVDLFNAGFDEQMENATEIKGRQTFIEVEQYWKFDEAGLQFRASFEAKGNLLKSMREWE